MIIPVKKTGLINNLTLTDFYLGYSFLQWLWLKNFSPFPAFYHGYLPSFLFKKFFLQENRYFRRGYGFPFPDLKQSETCFHFQASLGPI